VAIFRVLNEVYRSLISISAQQKKSHVSFLYQKRDKQVLEQCVRKLDEFDRVFNVCSFPDFMYSNGPTMDLICDCVGSSLKRPILSPA
jgi:hypothetical protein